MPQRQTEQLIIEGRFNVTEWLMAGLTGRNSDDQIITKVTRVPEGTPIEIECSGSAHFLKDGYLQAGAVFAGIPPKIKEITNSPPPIASIVQARVLLTSPSVIYSFRFNRREDCFGKLYVCVPEEMMEEAWIQRKNQSNKKGGLAGILEMFSRLLTPKKK